MRTLRFDLAGSLGRIRHNADGSITVPGTAARVHRPGDGLAYPQPDGTISHEYRDADELRSIVSQLPGTKVTLRHPSGLVRAGARAHIAGVVDAARIDGDNADVDLTLHDRTAIDAVTSRRVTQLSLGYGCNVDARGYQRNIQLDHLALVEAARCGDQCSLQLDHAPAGVSTMDPELIAAATKLNIRTDAADPRAVALAVITACGYSHSDVTGNGQTIAQRDDAYVINRAVFAAIGVERARADAAIASTFATVQTSVQRTDCGCTGGKPSPQVDGDPERAARERMMRDSRLAYATPVVVTDGRGNVVGLDTSKRDEAEAIEVIKTRTYQPIVRPAPRRGDSAPTDELAARQAMLASSRAAYLQPSADPLATDKE